MRPGTINPYLVGIGTVLACALVRRLLSGVLENEAVYLLFLVPVIATANLGGPKPAALAALLSAVAAPVASGVATVGTSAGLVRLLLFSFTCTAVILLTRQLRSARDDARRALEAERAAKEAAEEANAAKEQFVARVSHEWRGPLNTMSGWLFQLERRRSDAVLVERAIRGMRQAVAAQTRLVSDLLDYSRGSRGKLVIEPVRLDLLEPLQAALDSVAQAAEEKHLLLTLEATERPWVRGDAVRLQQVFTNLLQNATKFCGVGGRVHIDVHLGDSSVEIVIRDNGAGISPEALPRIFEPFGQGDRVRDASMGGLGLGLPIARELVQLHGGSIAVASEGAGTGSVFTVRLLRAAADGPRGDTTPPGVTWPQSCSGSLGKED